MEAIERRTLSRRGPFDLAAHTVPDLDMTPFDVEAYDPEDIEAWKNDEWHYVGLVVTASLDGLALGEASLWGIEDGYSPGFGSGGYADPFVPEYLEDLAREATEEAGAKLDHIFELAGLSRDSRDT